VVGDYHAEVWDDGVLFQFEYTVLGLQLDQDYAFLTLSCRKFPSIMTYAKSMFVILSERIQHICHPDSLAYVNLLDVNSVQQAL